MIGHVDSFCLLGVTANEARGEKRDVGDSEDSRDESITSRVHGEDQGEIDDDIKPDLR